MPLLVSSGFRPLLLIFISAHMMVLGMMVHQTSHPVPQKKNLCQPRQGRSNRGQNVDISPKVLNMLVISIKCSWLHLELVFDSSRPQPVRM
jgi:hypothetical protein